jgi:D-beta-D-heptose 7-phosphate kinase/D-beta-D-heptose 1-phosphate adenosyltransferase
MNLAHLGAQTTVIGFTGGDSDENLLADRLRANGIAPSFVVSNGYPTITKLRIVGGSQQMLRLDSEKLGDRSADDYSRLVQAVLSQLPKMDAVVLSDYAKGVLSEAVCQQIIQAARQQGIPILVDPKSANFERYRGATTICPNLNELSTAMRIDAANVEELLQAARQMVMAYDVDYLIATLSEKGIALLHSNSCFVAPAVARQVFDVSGAGDTVIAVLALSLACGLTSETAIELANVAAGIVVGKVGTVPVEKHELLAALAPQIALQTQDKILSREELVHRIALWKANGDRVVFTNGCFDLLHVGHITVLEQARRFGDRLIVAINSDASVRGLKGPTRPIVGENERGRVLAALSVVDAVVIFNEPTPLELILATHPDVIAKGGDYNIETVVGAQEVMSWGGQVRIIPIAEGFSTTRLIEKSAAR